MCLCIRSWYQRTEHLIELIKVLNKCHKFTLVLNLKKISAYNLIGILISYSKTRKMSKTNLVDRSGSVGMSDVTGCPQVPDQVRHAGLDEVLWQLGPT